MVTNPGMGKVWPWLRVLIGLGVLAILAWRLGTRAFLDGLREIDATAVLAALGLGLLTTLFSAWRWRLVAGRLGLRLTLATAVADYYRALFLNAALPGGVLGDVHRAVRHGRETGDAGRAFRAVALERTAGQVVVIGVSLLIVLSRPSLLTTSVRRMLPTPESAVLVVLSVLAVVAGILFWVKRSSARWRRGYARTLTDLRAALDVWPAVTILSVATLGGHLALFLVAARTTGLSAPVLVLLPLLLLALLAMGLPVNVGGWGPREGVAAVAFAAAGLGAAQGLAAAVVYGVLTFVASLPGAVVLFSRYGTGTPHDRRRTGSAGCDHEKRAMPGQNAVQDRWGSPAQL